MTANIHSHAKEICGSILSSVSTFAAIKGWQEEVSWGIGVCAGLVAITAGSLTIRSLIRKEQAEKKNAAKTQ